MACSSKKLLGWRPSLLGWRPFLDGWRPIFSWTCLLFFFLVLIQLWFCFHQNRLWGLWSWTLAFRRSRNLWPLLKQLLKLRQWSRQRLQQRGTASAAVANLSSLCLLALLLKKEEPKKEPDRRSTNTFSIRPGLALFGRHVLLLHFCLLKNAALPHRINPGGYTCC